MVIEYTEGKWFTVEQVEALFKSVGWESAQWPERLPKASQYSDTVTSAWDDSHLVGLTRVLDDTEMVTYMYWVLADLAYHGQHIGSHLAELVKAKYRDYSLLGVMPEESKNAPFYQKHSFCLIDDSHAMQIVSRGRRAGSANGARATARANRGQRTQSLTVIP